MRALFLMIFLVLFGHPSIGGAQERTTEIVWQIGGAAAPAEATWVEVGRGVIGADRVIVSDAHAPSVRGYGLSSGDWLATYGGAGQGPSEYQRPGDVVVSADTVRVHDFLQNRWSLFSLEGTHLRTTQAGHPPVNLEWGRVVDEGAGVGFTAWRDGGDGEVSRALITWRGGVVDTLALFPMNHVFFRWRETPQWRSTQVGIGPAGDAVVLGDTMVVIVDGVAGELLFMSLDSGGPTLSSSVPLGSAGGPISTDEEEWILRRTVETLGSLPPMWDDELKAPANWSAWTAVVDGGDGSVWVREGGREHAFDGGREVWHHLDLPSGRTTGRVTLDADVRLLAVRDDLALTVRVDDLDVETLQLRRIR